MSSDFEEKILQEKNVKKLQGLMRFQKAKTLTDTYLDSKEYDENLIIYCGLFNVNMSNSPDDLIDMYKLQKLLYTAYTE